MTEVAGINNAAVGQANKDKIRLNNDIEDFLSMLITQLENQDPTEPLDPNQFTQQIVQLSSVEQSINTNQNLESLISLYGDTVNTSLVSWTGQMVEVEGSRFNLAEEGGSSSFAYSIEGEEVPEAVYITVYDNDGGLVFSGQPTTFNLGRNTVGWDGLDMDGNPAKAGTYNLIVSAQNADGNLKELKTYVGGRVDGVNMAVEPPTLVVNDEEIPVSDVNFIGQPA